MRATKKKQNKLAAIINSIVGLLDKIKMDEDIRKTKKKAFKVLLYSLITLVTTFFSSILISLFLESFQQYIIDFGVDPNNNIIVAILEYIGVISIFTIALSSLVMIGNGRCERCFPEGRSTSILDGNNPAGPNYPGRHYTDSNMVSYTNRYHR